MRICSKCFAAPTWTLNAQDKPDFGHRCDFCGDASGLTWEAIAWREAIKLLVSLYEPKADGMSIGSLVQKDWGIFRETAASSIDEFLTAGDPGGSLEPGRLYGRRPHGEDDPLHSWRRFSDEIRSENRYHLNAILDMAILERAFLESTRIIAKSTKMYRARTHSDPVSIIPSRMKAPPREKASGGRANPPGIPYLYLAMEKETCIAETRAREHMYISIATLSVKQRLELLDLTSISPPDFFVDNPGESLAIHDYLVELGQQLSRPVRTADAAVDYIPTQYLCEYAKSISLDGVIYSSSLYAGGVNVVLFEQNVMAVNRFVELHKVDGVNVTTSVMAHIQGRS